MVPRSVSTCQRPGPRRDRVDPENHRHALAPRVSACRLCCPTPHGGLRRARARAQFFRVMAQVFEDRTPPLQAAGGVAPSFGRGTADEGGIDATDPIIDRAPETLDCGQCASERNGELRIGLAQQDVVCQPITQIIEVQARRNADAMLIDNTATGNLSRASTAIVHSLQRARAPKLARCNRGYRITSSTFSTGCFTCGTRIECFGLP